MNLRVARPIKTSPQGTVEYECEMLRFAWRAINTATDTGVDGPQAWMTIECFLLHFRNLIQLLNTQGQRSNDLSLATFSVQIEQEKQSEMERIAEPLRKQYSVLISRQLAHGTTQRHREDIDWPVDEMYHALLPAIRLFRDAFGMQRWPDEHPTIVQAE